MTIRPRIKICGITSEADAAQAAALGADAVGLNFYPGSPRFIAPQVVEHIVRELPPFVEPVGLYVNQPMRQVYQHAHLYRLRTIQWHGDAHEVANPYPFRLVSAFHVADKEGLQAITRYIDLCRGLGYVPAGVLVDAQVPGQYGGTGQTAPWNLLADYRIEVPLILAGGLTPDNVAEAVRTVRPYAVDVASGVEDRPGHKDPDKMRRFIENARSAF